MLPDYNNSRVGNINAYQHFFIGGGHIVDPELEWMVDLRKPIKLKRQNKSIQEPKFYKSDLEKYKRRQSLGKEHKDPLASSINIARCESIVRNPFSVVDSGQVRFGFTLRSCEDKHIWNPLPSPKKSLIDKFLPPLKPISKKNLSDIKDFLYKSKTQVFDVTNYLFRMLT
jgi:hypothetical protein